MIIECYLIATALGFFGFGTGLGVGYHICNKKYKQKIDQIKNENNINKERIQKRVYKRIVMEIIKKDDNCDQVENNK